MQRGGFKWGWPPWIPQHSHTTSGQTCLLAPLQPAKRNSVCTSIRPLQCISGERQKEREKKSLGRPSAPHFWCKPCRGTKARRQSFNFAMERTLHRPPVLHPGLCIWRFWHQSQAEHSFSVFGLELCSKTLWGFAQQGRKTVSAWLSWDDYIKMIYPKSKQWMDEDTFIVDIIHFHYKEDERKLNKYFLMLLLYFMVYLTFEMNDTSFQGILAKAATTPSCCTLH